MNRRRFFSALAVAPIAMPSALKAASAPVARHQVSTLTIGLDAAPFLAEVDATVAKINAAANRVPWHLLTSRGEQIDHGVTQQMIDHDLFYADAFEGARSC